MIDENSIVFRFNNLEKLDEWVEISAPSVCADILHALCKSDQRIAEEKIYLVCEMAEDIDEILFYPEEDPLVFTVKIEKLETPIEIEGASYGVAVYFGWDDEKQNFFPNMDQECLIDLVSLIRTEFETYLLALIDAVDDDLALQWDEFGDDDDNEEIYE